MTVVDASRPAQALLPDARCHCLAIIPLLKSTQVTSKERACRSCSYVKTVDLHNILHARHIKIYFEAVKVGNLHGKRSRPKAT